jgi:ribosome-associated heat shock protein Hsp15
LSAEAAGDEARENADEAGASLRLDKWLFHARFFRTRALAAALCTKGRLRLNRQPVRKAHQPVRPGDVLTFPQGALIRVVRVRALGERREGAPQARRLYEDLDPPPFPGNAGPSSDARPSAGAEQVREPPVGAGARRPGPSR